MKPDSEWLSVKPLADANLPAWVRAIQEDATRDLAACLRKYQARYHQTPHAQKDWDNAKAALDAVKLLCSETN